MIVVVKAMLEHSLFCMSDVDRKEMVFIMEQYRNQIVEELKAKGYNAEAKDVEKENQVKLLGISLKLDESRGIVIYIEKMYANGLSVEDAVNVIIKGYNDSIVNFPDISGLKDYEWVRKHLVLRMYNEKTNAEVYISAKRYGFDDLILVPYVNLEEGAIKVNNEHIEKWGVTKETLFADAMRNTKADTKEMRVIDVLTRDNPEMKMMFFGIEEELGDLLIITCEDDHYGASAILGKLDELKERFPSGFYVLPSSIHEVLVYPKKENDGGKNQVTEMVKQVSTLMLDACDVLSYKGYEF